MDDRLTYPLLGDVERLELKLLLEAIYVRHGYDFREYAPASLERMVLRAMLALNTPTISALQNAVLHEPNVLARLIRLLTVQVTDLFRDPEHYRILRTQIIPVLRTYPSLKIWIAGCSTGEEVLSLAILLREEGLSARTTLYATDIDSSALQSAKSAVYSIDRIANFTENHRQSGAPSLLSDYYTSDHGAVAFDRSLLDRVVFASHSLATDQVFGEMQLVSCRNVMIYFNQTLQARSLRIFSDALCRKGFLGLGAQESLGSQHLDMYRDFDPKTRWFRKC
jgi:chemotaxis protein methyltransferase CheR